MATVKQICFAARWPAEEWGAGPLLPEADARFENKSDGHVWWQIQQRDLGLDEPPASSPVLSRSPKQTGAEKSYVPYAGHRWVPATSASSIHTPSLNINPTKQESFSVL